ncbi:MAG: ankyrin repeat domain-containing protein [Candidatus Xenobiia bacterium LiM19]
MEYLAGCVIDTCQSGRQLPMRVNFNHTHIGNTLLPEYYNKSQFRYITSFLPIMDQISEISMLKLLHLAIGIKIKQSILPCLLKIAVEKNNKEMTRYLLYYDADPDIKNDQGITLLRYAIEKGYTDIANLLRKHGAKD